MDQEQDSTKGRKWKQLSEKERYKIEALWQQRLSAVEIGALLNRDRRTIERELTRGLTVQRKSDLTERRVYLADAGQRKHNESAHNKGRGLKIGHDHRLEGYIEAKIKQEHWSPDAVIGSIRAQGLEFGQSICTKTLYNYIDKGVFFGISNKDLWLKRYGKKRGYNAVRTVALNNKNGKSITERPEEANNRTETGHWEIDLVVGKQGTKPAILTLVERKLRRSLYALLRNKTQNEVVLAIERLRKRTNVDFETVTADNGPEFLDHEALKQAFNCKEVYYAHPYSSWERGSNENGNRVLRRFVPKGMDIGKLTEAELQRIEDWVNNYPRKILGYRSANQVAAMQ